MFKIKMLFDRLEGYKTVAHANTHEEALEIVKALKVYYHGHYLDVYYMYA